MNLSRRNFLTAAGVTEDLAELDGYGPIDPATARRLCAGAEEWIRVITHPVTAAVLAVDSYKPTKALRRLLEIRDQTCRAPGCSAVAAARCSTCLTPRMA